MCAKKRIYNQESLFGPLYAYLVVISPPEKIKADITQIKKEIDRIAAIGERNLYSIAHITLIDKLTDDTFFPETIQTYLDGKEAFEIQITGWDYFDHGHSVTVYLKIVDSQPIIELMQVVKSPAKSPHISLAKKISHETFNKIKPYLEKINYAATWNCSEIVVLKKLMSEKHLGFKDKILISLK